MKLSWYLVQVDAENNAEFWWSELDKVNPALATAIRNTDVPIRISQFSLDLMASLPGWGNGPAYAPTPVIVTEV